MKFTWFNLMPWPYLPDDFREKNRSVWVDIDQRLFDPARSHEVYNTYMDLLEYADIFDGSRVMDALVAELVEGVLRGDLHQTLLGEPHGQLVRRCDRVDPGLEIERVDVVADEVQLRM